MRACPWNGSVTDSLVVYDCKGAGCGVRAVLPAEVWALQVGPSAA